MKKFCGVILIFLFFTNSYGQKSYSFIDPGDSTITHDNTIKKGKGVDITKVVVYSLYGFVYIFNPILLYENDKIAAGLTKEFSLGFGYFGENRIAVEYSLIFRSEEKSFLYVGFVRDFLLSDLIPSNSLQTSVAVSPGISYFTNFSAHGIAGQLAFGYSIRNHKILIYPHIKAKYTRIFKSGKSDILNISFGITLGIANPFKDMHIRRTYE